VVGLKVCVEGRAVSPLLNENQVGAILLVLEQFVGNAPGLLSGWSQKTDEKIS
jgi:hypothetical protein